MEAYCYRVYDYQTGELLGHVGECDYLDYCDELEYLPASQKVVGVVKGDPYGYSGMRIYMQEVKL